MVLTPVDDEIRDCWFLVYDADAVCDRLATHYPAVQRSETA
jgi:hypothetical protein